jgi:hypothetical protein
MTHRIKIFTPLLFFFIAHASLASGPDDIIGRHVEAMGGHDSWQAVRSLTLTGTMATFSVRHDFKTVKTQDGKFYNEFNIGHQRVIEGHDGAWSWTIDPWQGFDFPRRINAAEENVFVQKATMATPFFDYQEKGHRVEYLGEEEQDGLALHVLKLIRNNGLEETWYLDADTYLPYKTISQWIDFATPLQSEAWYEDYREVDGVVIPFFTERVFANRLWATEVEEAVVNGPVDHSLFIAPACPGMQRLAFLEGSWHVEVSAPNRQGQWVTIDRRPASFGWAPRDVMQGEFIYGATFPSLHRLGFSYHRRGEEYQLMVYNDFASTWEFLQGGFEEDVLVLENTHSTAGDNKTPIRYLLTVNGPDGFLLERARSADQGETWTVFERLAFSRQ